MLESQIRAEQVATLYRLSRGTRYIPYLIFALLFSLFRDQLPFWQPLLLMAVYTAGTLGFDWQRRRFAKADPEARRAEGWARAYAALSAVTGGVWGATGVLLAQAGDYDHQMIVYLTLVAIGTTNVPSRSIHLPSYYAFSLSLLAPIVLFLAVRQGELDIPVAILALVTAFALTSWAHVMNRGQRESIQLRFENLDLIDRLAAARDEAEAGREAAEAGNRAKSEFLATMSHELRTPLNGILGMMEVMLKKDLEAELREYVQSAHDSGELLLSIISDILDFSRLEANRLELDIAEVDPAALAEGVAAVMAPVAQAKGIGFACRIAPDVPARFPGDEARLRQVLFNLIGNGIKFTEAGKVALELSVADDGAGRGRLRFEVTDTGIGIAEEAKPKLFERFSQGDASVTRRFGGTGLGLSICKRLVQLMGGEIGFDSRQGEGSRFWALLPLAPEKEEPCAPGREKEEGARLGAEGKGQPVRPAPVWPVLDSPVLDSPVLDSPVLDSNDVADNFDECRILFVDDIEINRKLAGAMLTSLGARFRLADSGEAALDLLGREAFDLVLMDLEMPGLSGTETARRIRQLPGEKGKLPILAVTAHPREDLGSRCQAAGMNDILSKPIRLDDLASMIRRWRTGHREDERREDECREGVGRRGEGRLSDAAD